MYFNPGLRARLFGAKTGTAATASRDARRHAAAEWKIATRRDPESRLREIARRCARAFAARRRAEARYREERPLRALHRDVEEDRGNRETCQANSRPSEALICYAGASIPHGRDTRKVPTDERFRDRPHASAAGS